MRPREAGRLEQGHRENFCPGWELTPQSLWTPVSVGVAETTIVEAAVANRPTLGLRAGPQAPGRRHPGQNQSQFAACTQHSAQSLTRSPELHRSHGRSHAGVKGHEQGSSPLPLRSASAPGGNGGRGPRGVQDPGSLGVTATPPRQATRLHRGANRQSTASVPASPPGRRDPPLPPFPAPTHKLEKTALQLSGSPFQVAILGAWRCLAGVPSPQKCELWEGTAGRQWERGQCIQNYRFTVSLLLSPIVLS